MNGTSKVANMTAESLVGAARVLVLILLLASPVAIAAKGPAQSFLWVGAGALTWALAVGIKVLTERPFNKWAAACPASLHASLWGAWSALTELGLAAVAMGLFLGPGSPIQVIALGAGAGAVEVLFLLVLSLRSMPNERHDSPAADLPAHIEWSFVVERTGAFIGHIGSRGLVWLALHEHGWAAPVAIAAFSLVDGVAIFGRLKGWDWADLSVWIRFYGLVIGIGLFELFLFLWVAHAL